MHNWNLIYWEEVDSTNKRAMQMLKDNSVSHRSVIYAGLQSSGKGQKGRHWTSPKGNSYSSYILKPLKGKPWSTPEKAALLGIVTAVSIGETLMEIGVPREDIFYKWPNDVWVKKAKIAGILPELYLNTQNQMEAVIVGAGVNLLSCPQNLDRKVASVFEDYHIHISSQDYLCLYLKKLDEHLEIWEKQSIAPIIQLWKAGSHALGELLKVKIYDKEIVGQFYDYSHDGCLILRSSYGELLTIRAGEVFFNE